MSAYSFVLQNIFLPCHNLVRGRHYVGRRRFLEESQWWSPDELEAFQWREATALLRHAWKCVPYYRKKFEQAGLRPQDIRGWADWRRLPTLTREEINANRKELCAEGYADKLSPHATGGSSGVPTRFYITELSYDWRTAATQRAYGWTGCTLGERAVYLWGAPIGELRLLQALKTKAYEFVQRQLIFNTFSQDDQLWVRIHERTLRYKPRLIVGYLSSLLQFARFLKQTGRELPGVKAVIAAAEPVYTAAREEIEAGLHAPLFNTYGAREFKSIAAECELRDGLHINSENILLETSDPRPEAVSELLITDLHNYGMPFIRYRIGDLGALDPSPCACGRGLPRIRSIEGRVLDMLRTADGRIIPGEFFPHLLKDIPEVRAYQVEQKSLDHIIVSAVLFAPLSDKSAALLDREIKKVCGPELKIELKPVAQIPRLASGKQRVTVGLDHHAGKN